MVPRMLLKLHPVGSAGTGWKGTFLKSLLCATACSNIIGSLPSDVGRVRERESLAQNYVISKRLSWYLNA